MLFCSVGVKDMESCVGRRVGDTHANPSTAKGCADPKKEMAKMVS
jgi:hypothetical protein